MNTIEVKSDSPWALPFFSIWTGQALSLLGSQLAQFALVWWVARQAADSALVLTAAMLVAILPSVLVGPFAGALVDRWNRRRVMIVADGFIALVSAWLAYLFWTDAMQIWHVYAAMFARSLGGTFHGASMQASTALMVPRKHLSRVAGANQTLMGALNIVSPPLGAFLMEILPLHFIMGIDMVSAAFAIAPLFFVSIPQPKERAVESVASLWNDVVEGWHYLQSWPGLLAVALLAMLLNFFISPAMRLLPLLVTNYFQGEAIQLGWLNSAWGSGLLLGGVILSIWGGFERRIITALMGIIGLGVGALVVGLTPVALFPLAVAALFFGAVMNSMCNGSLIAVLQGAVIPEMQGRVFSVVGSLCGAMTPIGLLLGGPAADAWGVRTLFIIAGAAQIVLGFGGFFIPAIMTMEEGRQLGVEPVPVEA